MRSLLDEPKLTVEHHSSPTQRRKLVPRPEITRRRVVVCLISLVVVGAVLVWLLYFSAFLSLKQVVVEGVRTVAPSQIVTQAQLRSGESLAAIDTDGIAARISQMNTVAHVEVRRRWPDTIVIDIVERDRVAVIKAGTEFDVVDQTGFRVEHKKRRPEKLPLLEADDDVARNTALSILHGFPPALAESVESAKAEAGGVITLRLKGGVTVMWGSREDSAEKTKVLQALVGQLGADKWVDLRSPSNPASARSSPTPAPPPVTATPTPTGASESAGATASGGPTPAPPAGQDGEAVPVSPPATQVFPG